MENNEYRFYRQDENGYPNGYGGYSNPEHHNPLEDNPHKRKKGRGGKAVALVLASGKESTEYHCGAGTRAASGGDCS